MVLISTAITVGTTVATTFALGITKTVGLAALGLATQVAVSVGLGLLARAATGISADSLDPGSLSRNESSLGYEVNTRGAALNHQIIYGATRVGGVLAFEDVSQEGLILTQAFVYSGHPIKGFKEVYLDGYKVIFWRRSSDNVAITTDQITYNDGSVYLPATVAQVDSLGNIIPGTQTNKYYLDQKRPRAYFSFHDGNQTNADAQIKGDHPYWPSNAVLRGRAYITCAWEYDREVFPSGPPELLPVIEGKEVYDPRTGITAWSDNTALCIRDYLTSQYGLNEPDENIDDSLVIAAANVCDQTNTFNGQKRFTCNGAFTTAETPYNMIKDLSKSMGGILWYSQGKWRMKPAYWTEPVQTFTEDDLRSNISIKTRQSRRDNFNIVKGTFRGLESSWQVADYPYVTSAAAISADNNEETYKDLNLPFCDNSTEARRIARIFLERNRQQLAISAKFGFSALKVQVGDNVRLTLDRFGWDEKIFEVVSWTFDENLEVSMTLRETAQTVFDEIDDGVTYERDNTSLPQDYFAPSVGLSVEASLSNRYEEVLGVLSVSVDSDSPYADYFEVQYKKCDCDNWLSLGRSSTNTFEILFTEDAVYDLRGRAFGVFDSPGPWSTVETFEARPFSPPPDNVESFSISTVGGMSTLSWEPVSTLDLSHYRVRYSPKTSGAIYSESQDLVEKVARPATNVSIPALSGTFFIKAVDKLGNESESPATITSNKSALQNFNAIKVISEEDTVIPFNGSKTNVVATTDGSGNDVLQVSSDASELFDSGPGLFDNKDGFFDGGFLVGTQNIYEFSEVVDLGDSYGVRLVSDLEFNFLDNENNLDSAVGLFDSRAGNFDGGTDQFTTINAKNQVSYTQDDTSGSPVWSDWEDFVVKDIEARGFRFRTLLTTQSNNNSPQITSLGVSIDVEDRIESEENISFSGGDVTITFNEEFHPDSTPAIGVSLSGLGTGDYYNITSKDNTGFTLEVRDSGGNLVSKSIELDYVAKGFGRKTT